MNSITKQVKHALQNSWADYPFKTGDRIITVREDLPYFGKGDIGTIEKKGNEDNPDTLRVVFDTMYKGSTGKATYWYVNKQIARPYNE